MNTPYIPMSKEFRKVTSTGHQASGKLNVKFTLKLPPRSKEKPKIAKLDLNDKNLAINVFQFSPQDFNA